MADTFLTRVQLGSIFKSITSVVLGSNVQVRMSWPTGGAPAWKITEDVVFIQVTTPDSPIDKQRDTRVTPITGNEAAGTQEDSYVRVIGVNWVLYGPNSLDLAQTLRDRMFLQTNYDVLARNGLHLIPAVGAPHRVPEQFAGQWWERADITMNFNNKVIRQTTANYGHSVDIIVKDNRGTSSTIPIQGGN